ncbi:hypothetical protein K9B33_20940 [Sphingobium sp. 3R8]|uniref:hypothetical protein n=1 Tax=Sphingobium sp. 3R8 TaxID=2874921 RepID=UPI001CCDC313|nr:hypothetical protein [Sphingobium sp. 3R8]MBZ9650005.1 hypothetical protein [Sphingobium sp. 3R8]
MSYKVKAECIDVRDGKRYFAGEDFPDPTDDQIKRLTGAGCIEEEKAKAAAPQAKPSAPSKPAKDA